MAVVKIGEIGKDININAEFDLSANTDLQMEFIPASPQVPFTRDSTDGVTAPAVPFTDPDTGDVIEGPLIVGTALLHTPHMGHNAALYSVDPIDNGGVTMSESVTVPVTWLDRIFGSKAKPRPSSTRLRKPWGNEPTTDLRICSISKKSMISSTTLRCWTSSL